MFKKLILTSLLAIVTMIGANAQYYSYRGGDTYSLVQPENTHISAGIGHMWNLGSSDGEFGQNYLTYHLNVGHWFNDKIGLTGKFSYGESTGDWSKTYLYTIGLELNGRLTDYLKHSSVDVELNFGLSYGRYDFKGDLKYYIEGVDYLVPSISLPIIFNLTTDKMLQFILEPSYKYYLQTNNIYYDDGCEVDANMNSINIEGRIRINF